MNTDSRFEDQGALRPPGLVGRTARFLAGVGVLWVFYSEVDVAVAFVTGTRHMDAVPPQSPMFWFAVLLTLWVFPPVVNIGFTRSWGTKPRTVIVGVAAVAIVTGLALYGNWWAPPLEVLLLVWMIYTFGHLGLCFLIASAIATPGCEMRAIPHSWTRLTGRATKEHFCPGFLDVIDRWERESWQSKSA